MNYEQPKGLDFREGKWLLGNIEGDYALENGLATKVFEDFSEELNLKDRLKYVRNEKGLMIPYSLPLNLKKSQILDLKGTTGFDYYINIKCVSERNDLSDFEWTQHNYFKYQMTYGLVIVEVYDLNAGEIIFTQAVAAGLNETESLSFKPSKDVIVKCYKKIFKEIDEKYIKGY